MLQLCTYVYAGKTMLGISEQGLQQCRSELGNSVIMITIRKAITSSTDTNLTDKFIPILRSSVRLFSMTH